MKVIGLLIVKDEIDFIETMLNNAYNWLDGIVAIDNGSTDGTYEILKKHPVVLSLHRDESEFDEHIMVPKMIDMARQFNADWYVDIDADEVFDPRIRKSIEECPSEFNMISVHFRYMIGDRFYRQHEKWNKIYRNNPEIFNYDYVKKLHNGKMPLPKEIRKIYDSKIPVYHYQIRSYEQGMRKYNNYLRLDPGYKYQSSYEHLRQISEMWKTNDFSSLRFF